MSSPPPDRSLEGLIADNWDARAVRPDVLALLEEYRESIEYTADDFDDDAQSWRDYRPGVFGSVPEEVMAAVNELLKTPYVEPGEVTQAVQTAAKWFLVARHPVPPERVEMTTDPAFDPWKEGARRAHGIDDEIFDMLDTAALLPGDRVEVVGNRLIAYRPFLGGDISFPIGPVRNKSTVLSACRLWMRSHEARWTIAAHDHAVRAHGDQRYGTEPYVVHLWEAFDVLDSVGLAGGAMGPAIFLHDTVEDTSTTCDELDSIFGYQVARLVGAVTKPKGPRAIAVARSNAMIREACRVAGDDLAASLKLGDRIANVRRSRVDNPRLFAMYLAEQPAFKAALESDGLGDPRLWKMLDEAFAT